MRLHLRVSRLGLRVAGQPGGLGGGSQQPGLLQEVWQVPLQAVQTRS
jgi:hypothetical protein